MRYRVGKKTGSWEDDDYIDVEKGLPAASDRHETNFCGGTGKLERNGHIDVVRRPTMEAFLHRSFGIRLKIFGKLL